MSRALWAPCGPLWPNWPDPSGWGRLPSLDVAGKDCLQEPAGLVGSALTGQLEDPMSDLCRQQGAIRHGIVRPTELEEGVAEPVRVVDVVQGGAEEVGAVVVPLPDAETPLGGTAPGGVDRPVVGRRL